jgi:hypothetical protein
MRRASVYDGNSDTAGRAISCSLEAISYGVLGHLEVLISDTSPLAHLFRTSNLEQEFSVIVVPVQKEEK